MDRVDLVGRVEQNSPAMARAPGIGEDGPLSISDSEMDFGRMLRLRCEPGIDTIGEQGFRKPMAVEVEFQLGFERRAVNLLGVFLLRPREGAFLDELAFGVEERGVNIVLRLTLRSVARSRRARR